LLATGVARPDGVGDPVEADRIECGAVHGDRLGLVASVVDRGEEVAGFRAGPRGGRVRSRRWPQRGRLVQSRPRPAVEHWFRKPWLLIPVTEGNTAKNEDMRRISSWVAILAMPVGHSGLSRCTA
jgi:hypothetical protein